MILDFKMKNYKSFYSETDISMIADSAKREHTSRLIKIGGNKKVKKEVIPAMVVYGGNASGKTSIISAINLLRQIVINGTIKKQIKNRDIKELDICSFIHDYKKMQEPIHLEITFKAREYIYNYLINVIASYMSVERKIVSEELNIVEYKSVGTSVVEKKTNIYKRFEKKIELNKDEGINKILGNNTNLSNDFISLEKIFSENLDKEDLFLTTGFKSMISLRISNDILSWFQERLIPIVDFNVKELLINFDENDNEKATMYKNKTLDRLIKLADFGPQEIAYVKDNDSGKFLLNSFYKCKGTQQGLIIDSRLIESKGTIKLVDFWMAFMKFFKKGGIFILDEFDCSIHPELVCGIIELFNNKDINTNNAQLIFNTHNPLYLNKKLFRRDQIMFVEKDEETYMSSTYKLSDIDVRNDANYMKNYFEGKLGALPFIDFEAALNSKERS